MNTNDGEGSLLREMIDAPVTSIIIALCIGVWLRILSSTPAVLPNNDNNNIINDGNIITYDTVGIQYQSAYTYICRLYTTPTLLIPSLCSYYSILV